MSTFTLHFAPNRVRVHNVHFHCKLTTTMADDTFSFALCPNHVKSRTTCYYLHMHIYSSHDPQSTYICIHIYTIWKIYGNCVSFGCDYDDTGCGTEPYARGVEAGKLFEIYSSAYVRLLNFSNLWFVSVYVHAGCGVLLCLMFYSCSNLVFEAALPNGLL